MATSSIAAKFHTDAPKAQSRKTLGLRFVRPQGGMAGMSGRELNNRIEYMVTCIGDFAAQHAMTPAVAYTFLKPKRRS